MKRASSPPPAAPRLLVVDVGNSSTALGVYAGGRIVRRERIPTRQLKVRAATALMRDVIGSRGVDGAALASVAPSVVPVVAKAVHAAAGVDPLRIHYQLVLGAPINYPRPEVLGADRLANLAGAVDRYPLPAIVVDIGTATTFDVIRPRKGYCGGAIAPGPALMLEYLAERTELLPSIDLIPVRRGIGRQTEEAMRLGALHGYRGMVKEIVAQLMRSLRTRSVTLCATGGYAAWVLRGMELPFVYDPDLTLRGIGKIYEWNA